MMNPTVEAPWGHLCKSHKKVEDRCEAYIEKYVREDSRRQEMDEKSVTGCLIEVASNNKFDYSTHGLEVLGKAICAKFRKNI